jgi:Rrf2 family iron-sulfur cluster assembly transcriptional regulator
MLSLPQTAVYALRAVHRIAEEPNGAPVRVADIATSLNVPRNYLSKTLHHLAQLGVLRSVRGPGGGFQLAKPAGRLTLAEVVRPFLPLEGKACILGRGTCNDRAPCAAHFSWKPAKAGIVDFFGETTIDTMVRTDSRA